MKKKIGTALVVGAGISGIRAALDLAEVGYGVTLIDRSPHLGGILTQLDHQFPTDRCGMCKMLPLVERDSASQYCLRKGLFHENIEILLSTEISGIEGEPGNFQVALRRKSSWVDPVLCIGCGACTDVCPVEVPDSFNAGLSNRKAIYLPIPHAIPNPYVIDLTACTRCGACEPVCPTGAIRLSQQERKKFRILVVDDERILRDSLKAWLDDEEGFTVDTAESGEQALDRLSQEPYNLMLLDIKMPGMDGVEVLERAKEIAPDLSVLMMTAYATVETAVDAMKIGALDYLIKPFDPENLIPKVLGVYEAVEAAEGPRIDVGAIVLCGGTAYFNPSSGKDTFGYGTLPNVVTSLEFERIMSGTGPCAGRIVRPSDEKPIRKVAWIHCVGSRNLQEDADFCSSVCCMYAIKEALLVKEKTGDGVETVLFYMDMRTYGKSFQRYRDRAEMDGGVRFERGRVHSVCAEGDSGDLSLRWADKNGRVREEAFDMVVLAVGQRPAEGSERLSQMLQLPTNGWGFFEPEPFSMTRTEREGIVVSGGFTGLKDISESVTEASAAALTASRIIHAAGGGMALEAERQADYRDVSREPPRILVAVCTCGDTLDHRIDRTTLAAALKKDPAVDDLVYLDQVCTATGWQELADTVSARNPNRLLIGACLPYLYARKIKELGVHTGLDPGLIEVADIRNPTRTEEEADTDDASRKVIREIKMSIARLRRVDPAPVATVPISQSALVVGGGIAGMTAALAIADHGFPVDLVEADQGLGGNLDWVRTTLEGQDTGDLLEETTTRIDKHPRITVYAATRVIGSFGQVGRFLTTVESEADGVRTLEHGVAILATGGVEAATTSYGYGSHGAIVTQKELSQKLAEGAIDPGTIDTVVMIQCVDSREEPRNYCSRVCCATALKHALALKGANPDVNIYVLYRDIMTYGFSESYFTEARRRGVTFVQYDPDSKPEVRIDGTDGGPRVDVFDPILGRRLEITADLVVLATGIVPRLPADIAIGFGAGIDRDGFFQEAESKWRPVDSLAEGVFACGLAHSPRNITETIATAEAAAQRSLRILTRNRLPAGKIVAAVRHSLCSLCERCIPECPYGARMFNEDLQQVQVNPVRCQGCGACAAVCPNDASVLEGFNAPQMFEIIDSVLE